MRSAGQLSIISSNLAEGAVVSSAATVVGRDREQAAVAAFLDSLALGPSSLLLEGEAGIGKTTLWRAGITGAVAREYLVLSSRPAESEVTLSFAALGDLMDGVFDEVLPQLPSPQRRALEVALLLADPLGSPPDQRAVCVAFLGVIRQLSVSRPVVIAVDDLQWLDRPSAVALEFALRRLATEPVGLLASVRIQAEGQVTPWAVTGLPAERVRRLRVGPLAFAAFEVAIRERSGAPFSRLLIRRLFDAADGSPFFGLELARALDRLGAEPAPEEPLPVPADLQGVLSARLAVLSDDVRSVLLIASCLRSPTTAVLARASGRSAMAALKTAAAEGVVEVEGGRVRFTHPLLSSAIYSGESPERRCEAHRRLAKVVPSAEERARHLALSAEGPDRDVAAALGDAALAAAARGAPAAAAELAELAASRTPLDQAQARWRRRLDAGGYLFRAGDTARARRDLEALAEEMPAGKDRARALLVLATILLHDAGDPMAVPVLEKALAEADDDQLLRARIHISIARTCGDDLNYCARHAAAGLALAQQAGDPGLTSEALGQKMYADFMVGQDLDLELGYRALDLESGGRPAQVEERASMALGLCLVRADRFDEARRMFTATLQAAQEEGDESSVPVVLAHLADVECWTGNWGVAERYAAASWEAAEQVEHRAWRSMAVYARALVDAHLGRVAAARAEGQEGLALAASAKDAWALMILHGVLGFVEMSAGDLARAEASLSAAADLSDSIGLTEPAAWRFHANHVEAVIGVGELDRAESLLQRLDARGRQTGRAWTLATAARCRALLLAAHGDTNGAVQALDEAIRLHEGLAMPFELGRTLLVMGQTQRRAKRKLAARHSLELALGIFDSLPASLWVERTRSELSRIGLRPPAPLGLTATEERVADMAAAGQTNRQVAQALFLSPRTVEANLARVYRKLGVSSRAELGAAMTRRKPAPPSS
jgi:DNA-binding CsgD family transcriptional regulator